MTERILITQPIDASAMALLETEDFEIDVWPGPAPMPDPSCARESEGAQASSPCSRIQSMLR